VFLEILPSPAQVILFPCKTHYGHNHCRPPRFKDKRKRPWTETQCEWEVYRARLLSLRAKEPPLKFSSEVKKTLGVDMEDFARHRYKALDDLLDGIFCAYLAYYFWCWGRENGCVSLPRCPLPGCRLNSEAAPIAGAIDTALLSRVRVNLAGRGRTHTGGTK
jgi:predicted RNase H-like nuclease